jgi:hypothetical protein
MENKMFAVHGEDECKLSCSTSFGVLCSEFIPRVAEFLEGSNSSMEIGTTLTHHSTGCYADRL